VSPLQPKRVMESIMVKKSGASGSHGLNHVKVRSASRWEIPGCDAHLERIDREMRHQKPIQNGHKPHIKPR